MPTVGTTNSPQAAHSALDGLLRRAAFAPLRNLGMLRVTGEDRVRWLNGMATHSIQALQEGEGCYTYFLNAQGRIQGDATVFAQCDSLLLETSRDALAALTAMLDRFIIMDDVELRPLDTLAGVLIAGPAAETVLDWLGLPAGGLTALQWREANFAGVPAKVIHADSPLVSRFEVWASPETLDAICGKLRERLPEAKAQDLEALRLLEGTALYGTDIRDRDLPQETALPGREVRALHFNKGCYLGQEIVERIRSQGNVHRTLAGFTLSGPVPPGRTPLYTAETPGKPIGELTSASRVELPSGAITIALGTIRREALSAARDHPENLCYEGGIASPVILPYAFSSTDLKPAG